MTAFARAAARQIHQPSPGRGHTDPKERTNRPKPVIREDASSQKKVADVRKRGEKRLLFYNLSPAALTALEERAQETRYQKAQDIKYRPSDGVTITGPLRTMDYFEYLCALARSNSDITFSALGQKGRDDFYPLRCGENDDQLIMAVSGCGGK